MQHRPYSVALTRPSTLLTASAVFASLWLSSVAQGQGAKTPFTSYEAEGGTLSGGATVRKLTAPATTNWSSPELEASGRAFVELAATGASVALPNGTAGPVTALDVRYSIPDSAQGGGITATLSLYVDGKFRQALPVSSKQIWLYSTGPTDWDGMSQNPADGRPHVFFEEMHALVTGPPIAQGSTIALVKDAAAAASSYWIDVVDLEAAPAALTAPAGTLSITDFGAEPTATPDGPIPRDAPDATAGIQKAFDAAKTQGKPVWIPSGRFVTTKGLNATGITIEGAGVWYSSIFLNLSLPTSSAIGSILSVTSCTLRNFLVDSNSTSRQASDGDVGGINISGDNWLVENMWIQHASSGVWAKGNNGTVHNCRVLSTWGDGVNLNNGNSGGVGNNLKADNNYVRGVGDDGVTINSDVTSTQMDSPTLSNNTTVAIWWADGLRVAGGKNVLVENNLLCDPVAFPGIIVGIFNGDSLESGIVRNNTIVRGGGDAYNEHKAALAIGTDLGSIYVSNVQITGNTVIDSMQKALEIMGNSRSITLDSNIFDGLWANAALPAADVSGIDITSNAAGSVTFTNNVLKNLTQGQTAFVNLSIAAQFQISGSANTGFDPSVRGPTAWPGPAPGALLVTSCTSPVPAIGDAGIPAVDGGAGSSDGGVTSTGAAGAGVVGGDRGGATGSAGAGPTGGVGPPSLGGTAGTGAAGAAATGTAGAAADATGQAHTSGGCACRVDDTLTSAPSSVSALLVMTLVVGRRQRKLPSRGRRITQ
jgi:Right handed beta helix region